MLIIRIEGGNPKARDRSIGTGNVGPRATAIGMERPKGRGKRIARRAIETLQERIARKTLRLEGRIQK